MNLFLFPALPASILLLFFATGDSFAADREKTSAMRLGRMKAMSCAGCHGMDGKGIERNGKWVAPAYSESVILREDPEKLALIILKGIRKESEHYTGVMGAMEAVYDDRSLAAVMTWVRNQFGGQEDHITADQVAGWRKKFSDRQGPIALAEITE